MNIKKYIRYIRKINIKKYIVNNIVLIISVIPNLIISTTVIFILAHWFHWSDYYSVFAYYIAQGFSIQYTVLYYSLTKTNFTIFGHEFHYADKKAKKSNE